MSKKQNQSRDERQGNRILEALAAAYFIAITAVYPLYLSNTRYMMLTRQKTTFFCMITGLTVFALLVALFLFAKRLRIADYFIADEPKRPLSIPEWALLAFLLLTLLSAIFSPYQEFVWDGFTTDGVSGRWEGFWAFLCYGLAFLIIARLHKPKTLHFQLFAGSAILVSLYGILQFMGFDFLEALNFFIEQKVLPGGPISYTFRTTLGNVNIISAYCSLVVILFAVLFAGERSRWSLLYLAASLLSYALLLIADSDAGKVGITGAMVLLIPYWLADRMRLGKICLTLSGWSAIYAAYQGYFLMMGQPSGFSRLNEADQIFIQSVVPKNPAPFAVLAAALLAGGLCLILLMKKWPERHMKIAGVLVLAVSAVAGLVLVEIIGTRWANQPDNIIWQAREILHGRMGDTFGTNRGWVWKRGISVVSNNPLLGTGPDTFYFALGEELQLEAFQLFGYAFDKAHNSFIQFAVCMGIPALLSYLVFLGGLFVPAAKKAFSRPLLLACGAAALSYLIQCFFQVDTPIDRPLMWVILGVMAGEIWRDKIGA